MNLINGSRITGRASPCEKCSFEPFCFSDESATNIACKIKKNLKQQSFYKKNQTVSVAQEEFKYLYIVMSGALKAIHLELDGRERILCFYFPGEAVGFEAVYKNAIPFSIVAAQDTTVCKVDYCHLRNTIHNNFQLQHYLLQLNSQRMNLGTCISYVRAEQRLVGFFLELAERFGCDQKQPTFTLPISRQAIADYLRLAPETVIRIMGKLQRLGLLVVNKKRCHLEDIQKLRWIVDGGFLKDFNKPTVS